MNRYRIINQETGDDYGEFKANNEIGAISEAMYLHSISIPELKNIIAGQINKEGITGQQGGDVHGR
jgi:hypothetical protein